MLEASPSPRRAWIEIVVLIDEARTVWPSPSPRRAWIEIVIALVAFGVVFVALPTEGVD